MQQRRSNTMRSRRELSPTHAAMQICLGSCTRRVHSRCHWPLWLKRLSPAPATAKRFSGFVGGRASGTKPISPVDKSEDPVRLVDGLQRSTNGCRPACAAAVLARGAAHADLAGINSSRQKVLLKPTSALLDFRRNACLVDDQRVWF